MRDQAQFIDQHISAELPDKNKDPELYAQVAANNIHSHRYGCDAKGEPCAKGFPAPLSAETIVCEHTGRVTYRRRKLADAYVVPYSPALMRKWDGHCCVLMVTSTLLICYLYKYLYKEADWVRFVHSFGKPKHGGGVNDPDRDEEHPEEAHQRKRYVSSSEGIWRIFGFETSFRKPAPKRCDMHVVPPSTYLASNFTLLRRGQPAHDRPQAPDPSDEIMSDQQPPQDPAGRGSLLAPQLLGSYSFRIPYIRKKR